MILKQAATRFFATDSKLLWFLLALLAVLVPALLYWGGLSGAFMLDAMPNLNVISQLPADPQWRDFWFLAGSGNAGVLGRPLSLISFLLQYQAWPDPYQFKLVNLLLHLFNGVLIAGVCVLLRMQTRWQLSATSIALAVFIWLAHPLQVSTVLYVVQRMTELATLFTLLGLNLYLLGRRDLQRKANIRGLALVFTGVFGCGALAVLSKESGALLLPLLAVLEFTLLAASDDAALVIKVRRYLIYSCTLLGMIAFIAYLPVMLQGYEQKPFSAGERTATQFSVLLTYVASMALLLPDSLGLFHDDFPLATSLWQPWYTVPAILLVLGTVALALTKRNSWPLFAFAVCWFLVGHALESTVLPLELYFEHRNYLPLFGPVFALVLTVQRGLNAQLLQRRRIGQGMVTLGLLWMCMLTWQQSRLWGDPLAFALASVSAHPESARAQSNLVETLTQSGQAQTAFEFHLSTIDPARPRIAAYVRWLEFRCLLPAIQLPDSETLVRQALSSNHDYGAIFVLNNLTFGVVQNRCQQPPLPELNLVLANLLQNPAFAISAPDLLQMQGILAAGRGDFAGAAQLAAASFAQREDVRVGLYRATWLLRAGMPDQARSELLVLTSTFADTIKASSDLSARLEFLQREMGLVD